MTTNDLDALRRLHEAATKGPFYVLDQQSGLNVCWGEGNPVLHMRWHDHLRPEVTARVQADANLVAVLLTTRGSLLAEISELRAERERLRELDDKISAWAVEAARAFADDADAGEFGWTDKMVRAAHELGFLTEEEASASLARSALERAPCPPSERGISEERP